jgi:hypothetical protein
MWLRLAGVALRAHSGIVGTDRLLSRAELRLTEHVGGPSRARAFAARTLVDWAYPGRHDDVILVVSELVSNAIKYGRGMPVLRLAGTADGIRVEVGDDSTEAPEKRAPGRSGGWGLHLIEWLGGRWGVIVSGTGKVVWGELTRIPAARVPRETVA